MYQEYGYLIHSKGPWKKNTKYKKKVKVNGVWKYIYTDDFKDAAQNAVWREVKGPGHIVDYMLEPYAIDENGIRVYDRHQNLYYDKGANPIATSINKSTSGLINKSTSGLKSAKQLINNKAISNRTKELSDEQVRKQRAARTKNLSDEQVRKQKEANDALARERRSNIMKNAYDEQRKKRK